MVGTYATHSPGTVVALFGIWAAGGAYCPIDPAFPAARQHTMLTAVGCQKVLATQEGLEVPPGIEVIQIAGITGDPEAGRVMWAAPNSPAYCLFTSGSTGEPKPVITSRRAIGTTVPALRELFQLVPGDRVLQFASLNWDTCFEEILPTLTAGATLVFHTEAHTGSFPRFLRMLASEQITVVNLPTAFWHELVHYLTDEQAQLPPMIRLVIIGGEAVSPARLADWAKLPTASIRLLNTYGCTETTLITHAIDLLGPIFPVPIGSPLPHVMQLISEESELLIGGPSLADGYLGRPEATETRFVTVHSGRFFRTGDRVGVGPGGVLLHDGRIDHEVKIRGIRVDPGEVEALIAAHPAVSEVAVTGFTVANHTALAAYVVPRHPGLDLLDIEIIEYLRNRVPAHLIPSRIRIVSELVYTASGKVDRRGLKEAHP
jgi:nonribosomal peptide synthetase protein VioO